MSRPLLAFVRSVGSALNAVVAAETTTGLGGRTSLSSASCSQHSYSFSLVQGSLLKSLACCSTVSPTPLARGRAYLGLLIVAATGLGSLWILKTEAFTKKD